MGNTASINTNRTKGHSLVAKPEMAKPVKKTTTRNERLIEKHWCKPLIGPKHDIDAIIRFCAPASLCFFKGADSGFPLGGFVESCRDYQRAFPDATVSWDSITEIEPGVIFIKNFKGKGTHTGGPFSYASLPPIDVTGIHVEEDPCQLTIHVKRGKMTKMIIDIKEGDLVGPPGYYFKIGGKLPPKE